MVIVSSRGALSEAPTASSVVITAPSHSRCSDPACCSLPFLQVLSIGHAARVSGHRFRINDITCHPVLPLLLTTSHHNLPKGKDPLDEEAEEEEGSSTELSDYRRRESGPVAAPTHGFCSELILWKVESVGPLSKSGGVAELARINSLEPSAFSNVAWVPTLLPRCTILN